MNHTQQNQPMLGDQTFPSEPAASNPFAGELGGEFSSNFGTNTHAVSQIFGGGGYNNGVGSKNIFIIVGGVVLLAALFFAYKMVMKDDAHVADQGIYTPPKAIQAPPIEEAPAAIQQRTEPVAETPVVVERSIEETQMVAEQPQVIAPQVEYSQPAPAVQYSNQYSAAQPMAQPASLVSPANGQAFPYDETQGPVRLNYSAGGAPVRVVLSRSPSMNPVVTAITSRGSSYGFHQASPGTWYWRVDDSLGGSTEVRSFTVADPVRRNISVNNPGTISDGSTIDWGGDAQVTSYRVEMVPAGSNWANPYRFATGTTSATISGVPGGDYSMRVGAHSRVSGRWEYTNAGTVSLQ